MQAGLGGPIDPTRTALHPRPAIRPSAPGRRAVSRAAAEIPGPAAVRALTLTCELLGRSSPETTTGSTTPARGTAGRDAAEFTAAFGRQRQDLTAGSAPNPHSPVQPLLLLQTSLLHVRVLACVCSWVRACACGRTRALTQSHVAQPHAKQVQVRARAHVVARVHQHRRDVQRQEGLNRAVLQQP